MKDEVPGFAAYSDRIYFCFLIAPTTMYLSILIQYLLFLEQTDSYYYYYIGLTYTRGIRRIFSSKHVGHVSKAITLFFALDLNIVALHKHFLQRANRRSKFPSNIKS